MRKAWKNNNLLRESDSYWKDQEQEFEDRNAEFLGLIREIIDDTNDILKNHEITSDYELEMAWSGGAYACGNYYVYLMKKPTKDNGPVETVVDYVLTFFDRPYGFFRNQISRTIFERKCHWPGEPKRDEEEVYKKLNKAITEIDNKVKPLYKKGHDLYCTDEHYR